MDIYHEHQNFSPSRILTDGCIIHLGIIQAATQGCPLKLVKQEKHSQGAIKRMQCHLKIQLMKFQFPNSSYSMSWHGEEAIELA